jgi:hypothetical protein
MTIDVVNDLDSGEPPAIDREQEIERAQLVVPLLRLRVDSRVQG